MAFFIDKTPWLFQVPRKHSEERHRVFEMSLLFFEGPHCTGFWHRKQCFLAQLIYTCTETTSPSKSHALLLASVACPRKEPPFEELET